MIIDTTNDELLINGQRWQRGGYLLATAYSTDQINITARDGRVIGKAIEWDRILDKDKNTFGLDRDGTVTALTNIFNSQVKSPYKIDALRDVENGTAAYGEIMIYRSPGEWQYEVLEQYHGAYDSEAATLRSGATATLELYYTAQADGDGISELSQSNTPASGYQIIRKLYYSERAQQDPDTGTWVQFADVAANTSFNDAKNTLLAYLKERTGGTVPISLKMTWEEVEIYNGLLDSYGGAAAAYSVRRLSSTYTGPLIEVERASDSTTQDIGYDANGDLDTTALATFCSGTTCTVRTWYDQSSNGNDAVQTTQANQPKIYDSSTGVVTRGGNSKPYASFNGSQFVKVQYGSALSQPIQTYVNAEHTTSSVSMFVHSGYGQDVFGVRYDGNNAVYFYGGNTTLMISSWVNNNIGNHLLFNQFHGASSQFRVDGVDLATANAGTSTSDGLTIGARSNGNGFIGYISELILYATADTTNRSGIETNVNDYFRIYTPFTTGLLDDYGGAAAAYSLRRLSSTYTGPLIRVRRASDNAEQDISADIEGNLNTGALATFCSGTDGFVKTWYCQSGNGNDATQTTTGSQPKIYDSSTGVVLDEDNNLPAALFAGDYLNSGTVSATGTATNFAVGNISGGSTTRALFFTPECFVFFTTNDWRIFSSSTQTVYAGNEQGLNLHYFGADSAGNFAAINGGALTTSANAADANTKIAIGTQSTNAAPFYGYVQECIYYNSDESTSRTGIETDINDFYNIYP